MNPSPAEESQPDADADAGPGYPPGTNGVYPAPPVADVSARRADIDAKQTMVGRLLQAAGAEAALLLMPAHVTWFTAGMNVRGLVADSERPGVYTNGQQRWLLCSNVDTHRLFDEELDRLGFQLKEWTWEGGRADLLMTVTAGRKVMGDRPFPGMPLVNDRLRPLLRVLSAFEQADYRHLGRVVVHAVEATARTFARGQTEAEVAGQLGHRLLHRGAEPAAVSVTADDRGGRFRRAGFTDAPVEKACVLQATAQRGGLYVTCSRAVSFGPPEPAFRTAYDLAVKLAAVCRAASLPDGTIGGAGQAGAGLLANTPYEFDGRLSQPGYGTGRFPAEELRRGGQEEPFMPDQAVVWQPRVGPAAVTDTVLVGHAGADPVTPPEDWPFKRVGVRGQSYDVPDLLVREG